MIKEIKEINEFKHDLLKIVNSFYLLDNNSSGYDLGELKNICPKIPEVLQVLYEVIGHNDKFLNGEKIEFLPPQEMTEHHQCRNNTMYDGIKFAKNNTDNYVYYPEIYWSQKICDRILFGKKNEKDCFYMPIDKSAISELLFMVLTIAQENSENIITITGKKLINNYENICMTELGAERLISFNKKIIEDDVIEDFFYSVEKHLLIKICTLD